MIVQALNLQQILGLSGTISFVLFPVQSVDIFSILALISMNNFWHANLANSVVIYHLPKMGPMV